jgi:hypothetical protein
MIWKSCSCDPTADEYCNYITLTQAQGSTDIDSSEEIWKICHLCFICINCSVKLSTLRMEWIIKELELYLSYFYDKYVLRVFSTNKTRLNLGIS